MILVSNDDGIHAAGLAALAGGLAGIGDVIVVAPEPRAQCHRTFAHASADHCRVSLVRPDWFSVDGTPTDCVTLAVMELLQRRPDLVVAGINHGANLGDDVTYSGTVASAIEGDATGPPGNRGIGSGEGPFDFSVAGAYAVRVAEWCSVGVSPAIRC